MTERIESSVIRIRKSSLPLVAAAAGKANEDVFDGHPPRTLVCRGGSFVHHGDGVYVGTVAFESIEPDDEAETMDFTAFLASITLGGEEKGAQRPARRPRSRKE